MKDGMEENEMNDKNGKLRWKQNEKWNAGE